MEELESKVDVMHQMKYLLKKCAQKYAKKEQKEQKEEKKEKDGSISWNWGRQVKVKLMEELKLTLEEERMWTQKQKWRNYEDETMK